MEPSPEQDVDFSEAFAMDKIGFNARNLNYWSSKHHFAATHVLLFELVSFFRSRVFVAIISGCAAGILGVTGLLG